MGVLLTTLEHARCVTRIDNLRFYEHWQPLLLVYILNIVVCFWFLDVHVPTPRTLCSALRVRTIVDY